MLLRCIHNTGGYVASHLEVGLSVSSNFGITIGGEYIPAALAQFGPETSVLIEKDRPGNVKWTPLSLFDIIDEAIPSKWGMLLLDGEAAGGLSRPLSVALSKPTFLIGYEALLRDRLHSDQLTVNEDETYIGIFRAEVERIRDELYSS